MVKIPTKIFNRKIILDLCNLKYLLYEIMKILNYMKKDGTMMIIFWRNVIISMKYFWKFVVLKNKNYLIILVKDIVVFDFVIAQNIFNSADQKEMLLYFSINEMVNLPIISRQLNIETILDRCILCWDQYLIQW